MVDMSPVQKKVFDAILAALDGERRTLKIADLVPFLPGMRRANIGQTVSILCNYGYLKRLTSGRQTVVFELALSDKDIMAINVKSKHVVQSENIQRQRQFRSLKRISREELAKRYKGRRYEDHDFKSEPEYLRQYIPTRAVHGLFSNSAAAWAMEG